MPADLVDADVFTLRRAHTAEDFALALLRPSRLGGLMESMEGIGA